MTSPIRILCVGAGHMGSSQGPAYQRIPGLEIYGIDHSIARKSGRTKLDEVSISIYPVTHAHRGRRR